MRRSLPLLLTALAFFAAVFTHPVGAQERIHSYDVEIDIRADGSLDIVERIAVRAEGHQIRRGIYRDFPTRYRDRFGNRVRVQFDVVGVERDGSSEAFFTERLSNGIRVNTGGDDFLQVPADYVYTLRYRTNRQLGFFPEHDELYFNAIGTGWIFPILSGTVQVRLPTAVPVEQMHVEGYTGPQGATGSAYSADVPRPGVAHYRLTEPLAPNEGFTIVLAFPKGLIPEPTAEEQARAFLQDNAGVLVALAGFVLLLVYCVVEWRRVGRDPRKGIIIPRYEPPPGHTPAGLRYLRRMGYDTRCFSSEVLALAVGGEIGIKREKRFMNDEWKLDRRNGEPARQHPAPQAVLLRGLFPGGTSELVLKNTNATTVQAAREAHRKQLDGILHPHFFSRNGRSTSTAVAIMVVTGILAVVTSNGFGLPIIFAVLGAMLITVSVFGSLVRAPTPEGRKLMDEVEGLRLYLSVAERDELSRMQGPDGPPVLDAKRYEQLLPYAVALEVEDAWTKKFTAAAGAAAAAAAAGSMAWYSGGRIGNLGDFSRAVGSSLSSQISSASSPPGSSSGSGGGGSSGGGGGGGGGGGR
jgi:uncharacterized membrane protein YgcG